MIGADGVLEGLVSKSDLAGAASPYLRPEFAKWRWPLDDATLQIKVKWIMSRPADPQKQAALVLFGLNNEDILLADNIQPAQR